MKKIALLLAAVFVFAAFAGCEGRGPEEAEAKRIVAELVEKSLELNHIYYGDGMATEADGDENFTGYYAYVTDDEPYKTEQELRAATLRVFTANYANSIFEMFLTGYSDEDSSEAVLARYVENGDRLQKNMRAEQLIEKDRTYDLDDITIVSSRGRTIVATLHSYVDGEADMDVEVTVRLAEIDPAAADSGESGDVTRNGKLRVWRLDSPTY